MFVRRHSMEVSCGLKRMLDKFLFSKQGEPAQCTGMLLPNCLVLSIVEELSHGTEVCCLVAEGYRRGIMKRREQFFALITKKKKYAYALSLSRLTLSRI